MYRVAHSGSSTDGLTPQFLTSNRIGAVTSSVETPNNSTGEEYVPPKKSKWSLIPIVIISRCCGLLPVCLTRESRRFRFTSGLPLLQSERWTGPSSTHKTLHTLLWIYSISMTTLCVIAAITMTIFIITEQINEDLENFIFDVIVLYQSALVSLCLLVFGTHLKFFLYAMDSFTETFRYKEFNKQDYFPGGVSINLASDSSYHLMNSRNKPVEMRSAFTQTHDYNNSSGSSSTEDVNTYDDPTWSPVLTRARFWNIFVAAVAVVCTAALIAFRIASQHMKTYVSDASEEAITEPSLDAVNKTLAKGIGVESSSSSSSAFNDSDAVHMLPLVGVCQWVFAGDRSDVNVSPALATFTIVFGSFIDCIAYVFNVFPQILLCGACITLMFAVHNFNKKAFRASRSTLDVDRFLYCHHKLRMLIKRLNNAFSPVIFITIVGDSFQIFCGTFMTFVKCNVQSVDIACFRCLFSYCLISARLVTMLAIGIAVREMAVSMLQWVTNCGLTGCKCFYVTRPFAFKFFALMFALIAIQVRNAM